MRTGRLTYAPDPVALKSLARPSRLPAITDDQKAAFLGGWWSGIAIGMAIGASLVITFFHGAR